MRFKKVTIENFKSIGSNPITVDLDFNGTKLICGTNGRGKSTIFQSVIWCLFGISKTKADNIVNTSIGCNTKVELEFSENNHNYVITRYRKHSTHKNNLYVFKDGENITLKNPTDNQELIQEIIGMDSRAFLSSIILSSETYRQFLRETNSSRLQIFESVFSLKEINDLSKVNKLKLKELEKSIDTIKAEINSISSFIEADTNALKAYKTNYEASIKNLDLKIKNAQDEIELFQKKLEENKEIDFDEELKKAIEYKSLLSNYNSVKENKNNLAKLLYGEKGMLSNYLETLDNHLKFFSENKVDDIKQEILEINKYEEKIKERSELDTKLKELEKQISSLVSDVKLLENDKEKVNLKIKSAKKQIEQINSKICPVCGNHIDSEHAKTVENEQNEIIDESTKELENIENSLFSKALEITTLTFEKNEIINKISDIDRLKKPSRDISEIKIILSKVKEFMAEDERIKLLIPEQELKIKELEIQYNSIPDLDNLPEYDGYTIESLDKLKKDFIDLNASIESNKKIISLAEEAKANSFDKDYVLKTANAIKERQENIGKLNSDLFNIRKDYIEYQILDEVFSNGDSGFKKYFINKTISLFNEKINTFLPFFFDDEIEIKFDKDLNDFITFRGKETEFEALSSGEKTRCELCIVFSLYFMVQSLFGCGTNLLVIDEILDTALDSAGILASRKILNDISKNTAVFVISHREELKESFTSVIEVQKDSNGFTQLKTKED